MDVDDEDREESIKNLITFFCIILNHSGLVFDGELIENDFEYMLNTMVDVDIKDNTNLSIPKA